MSLNITEFALFKRIIKLQVKPRLHDTTCYQTGCQTGLTTGWMFVYTIQPVVKPTTGLTTCCIVYTACCQTGCQTGCCTTGCQNRFDNRFDVCLYDTAACQTGCRTGWQLVASCKRGNTVALWNKDVKVSRTDAKILALVSVSASTVRFHLASRQS